MKNGNNLREIRISVFFVLIITFSVFLLFGEINSKTNYFIWHIREPVSYEREYLIRANYDYNDVYFSFTESIETNPPQFLAISNKLIYKINSLSEIQMKFPALKPAARILLMVNKNESLKPEALKDAVPVFESDHYAVYEILPPYTNSL